MTYRRKAELPASIGSVRVPVTSLMPGKSVTVPLEASIGEPEKIINHHSMKQLQQIYGAIPILGATGGSNMQPAFTPRHTVSQPTAIVAKAVEFLPWPRMQNPRKTNTLTFLVKSPISFPAHTSSHAISIGKLLVSDRFGPLLLSSAGDLGLDAPETTSRVPRSLAFDGNRETADLS